ncbi:MAG: hypothetical protein KA144_05610 [Xanthomonadaceae bacterium]|nr:hypothetical protein [Xanthomonadaceae bacterium]
MSVIVARGGVESGSFERETATCGGAIAMGENGVTGGIESTSRSREAIAPRGVETLAFSDGATVRIVAAVAGTSTAIGDGEDIWPVAAASVPCSPGANGSRVECGVGRAFVSPKPAL